MIESEVRKRAFAMPLTSPAYPPGPQPVRESGIPDRQLPNRSRQTLGISENDVVKKVMLKETVDGEFITVDDVAAATLFFAAFPTNALTGQSPIVSHGWVME